MHAGSGDDQITDSCQSGKRLLHAAHLHTQSGNLRHTAGNQRRLGIVAAADAVGNSASQGDDVLHGSAQLHANYVRIGIYSHAGIGEDVLYVFRRIHILTGCNDCGRHIQRDFLCVCRSGQSHHLHVSVLSVLVQLILQNLGHGHERALLHAFAHIGDDLSVHNVIPCLRGGGTDEYGRDGEHQHVLIRAHFLQASGKTNTVRNYHSRQILMLPGRLTSHQLRFHGGPYQNIVTAVIQHPRQRHANRSGTQYTNLFHTNIS